MAKLNRFVKCTYSFQRFVKFNTTVIIIIPCLGLKFSFLLLIK